MRLLEFQLHPHRAILLWSGNRHLPSPFSFIHHINFTCYSKGYSPVEIKSLLVWWMPRNFFPGLATPSKQFLAHPTFPDLPAWHLRDVLALGPRQIKFAISLGSTSGRRGIRNSRIYVQTQQCSLSAQTRNNRTDE
jgi:hypothetical protein